MWARYSIVSSTKAAENFNRSLSHATNPSCNIVDNLKLKNNIDNKRSSNETKHVFQREKSMDNRQIACREFS